MSHERTIWITGWSFNGAMWKELCLLPPDGRHHVLDLAHYQDATDLVNQATDAIEALGCEVNIVGWSMGAMLALRLATNACDQIRSLYLVSATTSFLQRPNLPGAWPASALENLEHRIAVDEVAALRAFRRSMFTDSERHLGAYKQFNAATKDNRQSTKSLLAGLCFLRDFRLDIADAKRITARVHLLHGGKDPICPPDLASELRDSLDGATLKIIPLSGHAPFAIERNGFQRWLGEKMNLS